MNRSAIRTGAFVAILILAASRPGTTLAQVIVPPQPSNLVLVSVDAKVVFDSVSNLYTYTYRVSNSAASPQGGGDLPAAEHARAGRGGR